MTAIALATRNAHKAREIQEILTGDFYFLNLNDFANAPAVEENASSFAGNALKKAWALAEWIAGNSVPALEKFSLARAPVYIVADDSGLETDALAGAPGVHSARFAAAGAAAGVNASDAANNAKLLERLEGVPLEKRTARFRCVLAVIGLRLGEISGLPFAPRPAEPLVFEGVCDGRIALAPKGLGGFGYDPLFIPDGWTRSFAELGEDVKNTFSHRSAALRKFRQFLEKNAY
jgi:XTP/dITP diphosphohydrolase